MYLQIQMSQTVILNSSFSSEPTDDESLRLTEEGHSQSLPVQESEHHEADAEMELVGMEEESCSTSCSSAFVKLQIVNGAVEGDGGGRETVAFEADDVDTIDEDQPDEDAAMIVVTRVSSTAMSV